MNCDDCKYYEWCYNHCRKWDCEKDAREIHNCFEAYDTPVRDKMVNYNENEAFLKLMNIIVCLMNHFKYKFWYEIKTPDKYYLDFMTKNIYEAIDKLNDEKKHYII